MISAQPIRVAMFIALFLSLFAGLQTPAFAGPNVKPSLAFETLAPRPGSTIRAAVVFNAPRGWHTYWTNPGDSGAPPRISWKSQDGLVFSQARHPVPKLFDVQGIASYVHEGEHALLLEVKVPEDLTQGSPLPVTARIEWLACSDTQCVPESATLQTTLVAGVGDTDFPGLAAIRKAESAMPSALSGFYYRQGKDWVFDIPGNRSGAYIFPSETSWFAPGEKQQVSVSQGRTLIKVKALGAGSGRFSGVIRDAGSTFSLKATQSSAPVEEVSEVASQDNDLVKMPSEAAGEVAKASNEIPVLATSHAKQRSGVRAETVSGVKNQIRVMNVASQENWVDTALWALGGAILGGLLLNLMPCVFPILSLKALSLAKASQDEAAARAEGLGYTAGAVMTTTAIGAVLVGMKALGMMVGWSFQLQNPLIVFVLLVIVLAIALNLIGAYEVRLPVGISGGPKSGWRSAFASGGLAAFIATPCSGPFMAGALGAVLVLPAAAGLAVFAGLGLGMALPFLALAFVPALRDWLPKPGKWMVTMRKWLSLPMFLTALWLAWVLTSQTDIQGMTLVVIVLLASGAAIWWIKRNQEAGGKSMPGLVAALIALAIIPVIGLPSPSPALATTGGEKLIRDFSVEELDRLRAQGTPVFVDFTARWCLSCKVNEKVAINRKETQEAFAKAGVVTLIADWTNGDPEITKFLEDHGRNSIPFYLFYTGEGEPDILPQILSVDDLVSRAENLPGD